MRLIGITGDSGVGKSTLALTLSKKLKCPFLDIDKVILGSEFIDLNNKTPKTSKMKPEYFKLLIDNLEDLESGISILLNNIVESKIKELSKENDTIIVEWMFLHYLKIWQECDTKILIHTDERLRKCNAINNKLITEQQYDECVAMVKLDYRKFRYDYIFGNKYDYNSMQDMINSI